MLFSLQIVPADDESLDVSRWDRLIEKDTEFRRVDSVFGRNPMTGESIDVSVPGSAIWVAHPDGVDAPFFLNGNRIVTQWADEAVLAKARKVAENLGALVDARPED
jgi:hypothetical protein